MIFRLLGIAVFLVLLILTIAYICFRIVFYAPYKKNASSDELPVPKAGHGLVYLVDNNKYFQNVVEFFSENGVETKLVKQVI